MNQKVLSLKSVKKQYKAGHPIFEGVSMEFQPGDSVGLVGPNGSGKTTFLKLLSVNTFPTEGMITYGGVDIHQHPHEYLAHVGLVHDEESLPRHLSATELLEWVLRARKRWDRSSEALISGILDNLNLGDARFDQIGTYSTGMRKKTQIASAMIAEPSVYILDEPFRGLDEQSREMALELFSDVIRKGAIFLMASHAKDEVTTLFDRVLEFPL
ncbi:MAG: ABC transporter ATP-binding protein [Balneolaceae bacterium]